MIQGILEKLNRTEDPVYVKYLELLKSDKKKTFHDKYFIVETAPGKNMKVTFPKYINLDHAIKTSKSAKERVELQYLRLLSRKKVWSLGRPNRPNVQEFEQGQHFYIATLPTITETTEKVAVVKVDKKKKQQQKIKEVVIGRILGDYPFNLFNFKTLQECESRETSKPYYVSKKDLLEIIDKNSNIKQLFPKGYKTFKKEQICKVLVENRNA